ncbi:hypothetical protein DMH04_35685 [Kibdelosporangium aridum]|uniref:DUF3558 domain-containing protein n=1 Tax=Kibdelosporangium aridum TaxID=2030 RepID=A0A428YZN8_KIBAR|nr:DUF3558 family protein [Kibdelosporangium aridum]RSM76991.1 hypothetical protein DMH04_35685 [Kibdelosporangium aridum]
MADSVATRETNLTVRSVSRPKTILAASVVALVAATLVACTSETPGLPAPGGTSVTNRPTVPGGGGSTGTTKPSGTNAESPLRDADPCALFTSADAAALGAGPGQRDDETQSRGCVFTASGKFNLRVLTFAERGTKDVVATGGTKELPPVGKHQAVQAIFGQACAISLAVTETSRVDMVVSANGDTQKGCQIAAQVAQVVEPKLPGGS